MLWEHTGACTFSAGSQERCSEMTSKRKGSSLSQLGKVQEGYKYSELWVQVPLA